MYNDAFLGFWHLFSKFSCHVQDRFWFLGSIIINIITNTLDFIEPGI